jgi:hypothetical protein
MEPPAAPPEEQALSLGVAPVLAGCGTPTIDGVLSPGEWDGAVPMRHAVMAPGDSWPSEATIPAEVRAWTDDRNLYVALRLGMDTSAISPVGQELDVRLQDNDALTFFWEHTGPASFEDGFVWSCILPSGFQTECYNPDTEGWKADLLDGTIDGGGAIHFADGETTIELWHPYADGDPRDVQRTAGQSVSIGFALTLAGQLCSDDGSVCLTIPYTVPLFGDAFLLGGCSAPPPAPQVVEVRVDAPGAPLPTIEFGGKDPVTLVVMGSAAFDVADVDPTTLFVTGERVEVDAQGHPQSSVEDFDGDGVDDLVARFDGEYICAASGDGTLTLAGRTRGGRLFQGSDAVRCHWDPGRRSAGAAPP